MCEIKHVAVLKLEMTKVRTPAMLEIYCERNVKKLSAKLLSVSNNILTEQNIHTTSK